MILHNGGHKMVGPTMSGGMCMIIEQLHSQSIAVLCAAFVIANVFIRLYTVLSRRLYYLISNLKFPTALPQAADDT